MASDLISRKALLEAMDKEATEMEEAMCIPSWATAKHCIKAMPTVDGWIPCSERLPEENALVLVTYKCIAYRCHPILVTIGWQRNGKWLVENGLYFQEVYAWMPLPEPYKDGDIDG